MSCHVLITDYKQQPIVVLMGWSVPDQAYFLIVDHLHAPDGSPELYACLPDQIHASKTLSDILHRLKRDFDLIVPDALASEVIQDCLLNRADAVATHWVDRGRVRHRQAGLVLDKPERRWPWLRAVTAGPGDGAGSAWDESN